MSDCSIVIASYGERSWLDLGTQRAAQSAFAQDCPVIYIHGTTLHGARNAGLAQVETEAVVFLDADDELAPSYAEAMMRGTADLRVPVLRQVRRGRLGRPFQPQVWGHTHECSAPCMLEGNFAVVGACVRTDLAREVGGFWDEPVYEDWSLWLRCYLAGATTEWIHDAIYVAHHDPATGRNHSLPNDVRNEWHYKILAAAQAQQAKAA